MPYIVKSSLEVGSTIIPWNEQESQKLMQEKKQHLEKEAKKEIEKNTLLEQPVVEAIVENEAIVKEPEVEIISQAKAVKKDEYKSSKKIQKAGEK